MNQENDNRPLMVSISCITYNHEPYIRQCLEGFVMQKTNFRFEAIVHDDASTDGTAAIIREYAEKYPDIIKPILETENQYSKHNGSLGRIMDKACRGKYIAYCEGDDYWIDPNKLQSQVDCLEQNKDCGLVYTGYYEQRGQKLQDGSFPILEGECLDNYLLKRGYIPTQTVMLRADIFFSIDFEFRTMNFLVGDVPIWIQIMYRSKVIRLPMKSAVYRLLEESASHSQSIQKRLDFAISAWEARKYYANKYNKKEIEEQIDKEIEKCKCRQSLYKKDYLRYIIKNPLNYEIYLSELYAYLKNRK